MSAKTKKSAAAPRRAAPTPREPTHDEIALCAMTIWIEEGRPEGRDLEHWLLAEARLRQACAAESPARPRRASRHAIRPGPPPPVVL